MARPKLGSGDGKTEVLRVRVRPLARRRLLLRAAQEGITESEAVRRAVAYWLDTPEGT